MSKCTVSIGDVSNLINFKNFFTLKVDNDVSLSVKKEDSVIMIDVVVNNYGDYIGTFIISTLSKGDVLEVTQEGGDVFAKLITPSEPYHRIGSGNNIELDYYNIKLKSKGR